MYFDDKNIDFVSHQLLNVIKIIYKNISKFKGKELGNIKRKT